MNANRGFKSVVATGAGQNGRGESAIELDEAAINNILKKSDEYSGGWKVHSFNDQEVLLSKFDAGSNGMHFLPLKRVDIQRLHDAQKPQTMKIKG